MVPLKRKIRSLLSSSPKFSKRYLQKKIVRNDKYSLRVVYLNEKGVQVGVVTSYAHEPAFPINPFFVEWSPFRVAVPLESSRRFIHYRSIRKAEQFLKRELHPLGRFLNSLTIILTHGNRFARTGWK